MKEPGLRTPRTELYHNVSTLLEAGLPPTRAFPGAAEGLQGDLPDALRQLGEAIIDGEEIEDFVEARPHVFPSLDRTLIRVGESSGHLPDMFRLLSEWYAFESVIRRQLLAGLVLPAIVIHMAALVLPIPSLFAEGGGLGAYLLGVVSILAFWYPLAALTYLAFRVEGLRRTIDPWILSIPLLGKAILRLELSRYCRAFGSLYSAGISASECARLAAATCGNRAVRARLAGGADSATRGELISSGFTDLPLEFTTTWHLGEESGQLDEVTGKLAQLMADDAQFVLREIARWIPRIVYALVVLQLAWRILGTWGAIYG